jgi:radical SAM superfamily enzyme YgiQ (UPF0313 family)
MKNLRVVFIDFEYFDNLGVGYMSSILSDAGYEISVIDFRDGKKEILKILKKSNPLIVGFSLIFQYYIYEFAELIKYLRERDIKCHFTGGGHYASLACENLFDIIPSLDSIVRFDGEYTLLELANCIHKGKDWKKIKGIAYKSFGKLILNPLRPVEKDLDNFPFPMRSPLKEYALGKKFATIIAGRGCINNCSFCSVKEYYHLSSGPIKRIRQPEKVVEEMELLHLHKDCSVFLFQDDDFPVKTGKGSGWIEKFCKEINRKKLTDKIMWKINCRPDEVDYRSFAMMKDHGLFLVFLGIEDGTDIGLSRLNKHLTVAEILEGVNIIQNLDMGLDYGFMPFHPASTYSSVKDNFDFLRNICKNGFTSVTFLKMLPFYSTAIERELSKDGRLRGTPGFLNYDFLEESLNHYYLFSQDCFLEWMGDDDGLFNRLKWARNYISVFTRFFEIIPEVLLIKKEVSRIIDESNTFFLDTLQELAIIFETGKYSSGNYDDLRSYRRNVKIKHDQFKKEINNNLTKLMVFAEFQQRYHFI